MSDNTEQEVVDVVEPVQEKTLSIQRILLTGELDSKTHHSFYGLIRIEQAEDPILLELASHGGDVGVANSCVEYLVSRNCPVLVLCLNEILSAAIYFLGVHGSTRLCYPSTSFMSHQARLSHPESGMGSLIEWELESKRLIGMSWERVKTVSGLSDEEIKMLSSNYDMYFNSFDALSMGKRGLVDGIIIRQVDKRNYYVWTREGYKYFRFPADALEKCPVLTDEEVTELKLPKITYSVDDPACFKRYRARNPL